MTQLRVTPPGDNNPPDAPPPHSHTIRMVPGNGRLEAYCRYSGLSPTDIAGEGPWVTMAEAEAEVARRGITVDLPDPLPPMTEAEARWTVRLLHRLGARLIKLQPGRKNPVETAWQHADPLTEDEAVAWLVAGGNIGINLLRSGWLVLDAENAAATDLLIAADLMPTARTANAQDPTSPKLGGCHVWMPLPAGTDPATLVSKLQIPLVGGGLLDSLVGTRYIVGPGSRLDSAPGYRYGFDPEWLAAMAADETWSAAMKELEADNV